ncbi:MAG: threonine--tRNA ligase [Candidatus Gottesmanbacteria bacterium]|nr:threonine--tRNA ligase [Candidatus Gottesmanbacteria bacterium]
MKHNDNEYLNNMRHSCAHLLAHAIKILYPGALNAIGPAIEHGFYQDFDMGKWKISEEDFPKIEAKMREILPRWVKFSFNEISLAEAIRLFKDNKYKVEMATEFAAGGKKLMTNDPGDFLDLCKMGHVENPSKELSNFELLSVAGAYWRGSEKNKMLTRIYGTCFPTKDELDAHLHQLEESKKRDHRKIGQDLDLFSTNPLTGQGLILWHPKLSVTRNIVEQFWKAEHYKRGYQLVYTPHIASMDMFVKSRHLSKYINSMFPVMLHEYIEGESAPDYQVDEILKPMNCPNHIQIYKHRPRSYRELPLRIGELGTVYRYERAGVLHGLTRVRGFTQDDSHIFCTSDQVIDEVRGVLRIMKDFYALFGFKDYQAYISTRPEKYLGTLETWHMAEESLKKAAADEGFDYKIDEGEGVFYGPKIDIKVKDSIGREWQLGTVQFDFNQPSQAETTDDEIEEFWKLKTFKHKFKTKEAMAKYLRKLGRGFNVTYVDADGKEKQCVMIHRVIFGSLERFFGILIEHYAGAFPVWLAPVQVALIPIAERHNEGAKKALQALRDAGLRVELDDRNESMQAKIRNHTLQKVPYLAIMGDREIQGATVSVRTRSGEDLGAMSLEQFVRNVNDEIERKH